LTGFLNMAMTGLFDILFRPFRGIAPIWSLIIFSVLTGILMLWIFGKVSNQDKIRLVRDRVRGNLMAIRLFGDSPGVLFMLQWRILRDTAVYLKFALVPLLIMLVPVLLIIVQMNLRYAADPLEPGQAVMLKVTLSDNDAVDQGVTLETPAGVTAETPAVRINSLKEVAYRIRADLPGRHVIKLHCGEETIEKELLAGGPYQSVSTLRTGAGFFDKLLYPGEPPIAASSSFESIELQYGEREIRAFGFGVDWLIGFFIISVIAGFAFKGVLGVEI